MIRSVGFAIGLLVGIVIAVILIKMSNTNRKLKVEYDERQKKVLGDAYKYSFWTYMAVLILEMALFMSEDELPVAGYLWPFFTLIIGVTVYLGYSIWHGVYWGLNNNRRRYMIVMVLAFIFNVVPIIGGIRGGYLIEDGKAGMNCLKCIREVRDR